MQRISLFERYRLGQQALKNRIVMAPMTRARSLQPGNIPSALMAEYYRQRASAGLIITEATQISPQGGDTHGRPASIRLSMFQDGSSPLAPCIRRAG